MIRLVTDTGSDITSQAGKSLGVEVVELAVNFDEFSYDPHSDQDFSVFYDNLTKAKSLPRTSQPTPASFLDIFNDAKEKGDEVLVITLSGGLSGTHASAVMAKEDCDYDAITLIDSRLATTAQRMLVDQALKLREQGKSLGEIEAALLDLRERIGFCCCLDTLTYLKKGGRVPPALALIGNALKFKPVLTLKDGKVEPLDKVRGFQAGIRAMWSFIEKSGFDNSYPVIFGHTNNEERGKTFMEDTKAKFDMKECCLLPVGGVIGTHAGPNCVVVTYVKK